MSKTAEDNQNMIEETKAHLIKRVKNSLQYKMDRIANHLQELHARLNDNYLRCFAECGLSIYRSEYELKELKRLMESLEDLRYEDVVGIFEMRVKRFTNELLEGALSRHSTDQIVNITYVVELEAKQRMREYFARLLDILNEI